MFLTAIYQLKDTETSTMIPWYAYIQLGFQIGLFNPQEAQACTQYETLYYWDLICTW